jgi:hypothetical protein
MGRLIAGWVLIVVGLLGVVGGIGMGYITSVANEAAAESARADAARQGYAQPGSSGQADLLGYVTAALSVGIGGVLLFVGLRLRTPPAEQGRVTKKRRKREEDFDEVPRRRREELPPVEVADEEAVDLPPRRSPRARSTDVTDAPRRRAERQPEPEPAWVEEVIEEADEQAEEVARKRRKGRRRRRALEQVNVGLAIHYGGMVGFLLGQIAGWLGLLLLLIAVVSLGARKADTTSVGTLVASGVLFLVSWGLTSCASITDVVSSAFCLRVPDPSARGFLLASLIVRLLALPAGVVLVFVGQPSFAVLSTSVLAITGWALWVAFLRMLALALKQPELGEEAVRITLAALYTFLGWIMAMVALVGLIVFLVAIRRLGGVFLPCFVVVGGVTLVAGILRSIVLSGRVESLFTLLLYPTGIPLVMRYLDLISTMRMIILRRS